MIVAVASGKGGTGKTTVAVSLALAAAARRPEPVKLLDCDVEAPNAALFLQPQLERQVTTGVPVPEVDLERCAQCGLCADVCAYNAISVVAGQVLVFPELCHGCGSCVLNCPAQAIRERHYPTGLLEAGHAGPITFGQGTLKVGQAMATPIIKQLKEWLLDVPAALHVTIIDAPPGVGCPVLETLRGTDYVLLVTEPTPFGLHDLRQVTVLARDALGIPCGVIINRENGTDDRVERFCSEQGLPVLARIPFDRRVATAGADGVPLVRALPEYRQVFSGLLDAITGEVTVEATGCSERQRRHG
jgi:MinD superfamily P-loop ATPase